MSEQGLKPCPFCGKKALVRGGKIWLCPDEPKAKHFSVQCGNCPATMNHWMRGDAIAAWNRRAE